MYTSEGADKEFVLLHKGEFGTKDVKNVRILGSTGGPGASLDVRVSDLHIRADDFVRGTDAIFLPAARADWRAWHVILIAVAVPVALACSLGVWLFARRRSHAAVASPAVDKAAPQTIAFRCPGCGQSLRAKNEMAGAKVKCPQCSQAVVIPLTELGEAEELS